MPAVRQPLTPEQWRRRRMRRRLAGACVVGFAVLFYVLYLGDNRWRVRYQHGVRVPASARGLRCAGCTAFPMTVVDGDSWARFTINGADLRPFLSQFQICRPAPGPGGFRPTAAPWPATLPAEGREGCFSPTGRDFVTVEWHTSPDGNVAIELHTDWN